MQDDTKSMPPFHESPRFWGALGIVLTLVVTAVAFRHPNVLWLIVFAWPFSILVFWESFNSCKARKSATTISSIISAAIFGLLWWYLSPPTVYEDFADIPDLESLLGQPTKNAILTKDATEAWAENAYLFWLADPGRICAFAYEPSHDFSCQDDPGISPSARPDLFDNSALRQFFHLGKNDVVPVGGFASALKENPKKWDWIGKFGEICTVSPVHWQQFSGGRIYGPFRLTTGNERNESIVFLTYGEGEWRKINIQASPPKIVKCDKYKP